jgi:membrane protease subunit (stomatin/prohibitin family)
MSDAGTSYQQVGMADAMVAMGEAGPGAGGGGQSPMDTGMNLGLAMMMPQMMSGMLQGQGPAGVTPVAAAAPTETVDPIPRIKQLKELLDIEAISKEEFDLKKAELMKRI